MSWDNFKIEEFACKHCGENKIEHELIDKLQLLRSDVGFPFNNSTHEGAAFLVNLLKCPNV